eukprot:592701-Prymnesium_polylepis.2
MSPRRPQSRRETRRRQQACPKEGQRTRSCASALSQSSEGEDVWDDERGCADRRCTGQCGRWAWAQRRRARAAPLCRTSHAHRKPTTRCPQTCAEPPVSSQSASCPPLRVMLGSPWLATLACVIIRSGPRPQGRSSCASSSSCQGGARSPWRKREGAERSLPQLGGKGRGECEARHPQGTPPVDHGRLLRGIRWHALHGGRRQPAGNSCSQPGASEVHLRCAVSNEPPAHTQHRRAGSSAWLDSLHSTRALLSYPGISSPPPYLRRALTCARSARPAPMCIALHGQLGRCAGRSLRGPRDLALALEELGALVCGQPHRLQRVRSGVQLLRTRHRRRGRARSGHCHQEVARRLAPHS